MRRIQLQALIAFFALFVILAAAETAFAQVDPSRGADPLGGARVIVVTVGPTGETTVRCSGMECDTVDCSGNGQLMASGEAYFIRRDDADSCSTEPAPPAIEEAMEIKRQELEDSLLAALTDPETPTPESAGESDVLTTTESNQNQNQVQGTGESDGDSATPTGLQ